MANRGSIWQKDVVSSNRVFIKCVMLNASKQRLRGHKVKCGVAKKS